jgi:hypothetical protein
MTSQNTPLAFSNYLTLCMMANPGFYLMLNTDEMKWNKTGEEMDNCNTTNGSNGKFTRRV